MEQTPSIVSEIIKYAQGASQLSIIAILAITVFQLARGGRIGDMFTRKKTHQNLTTERGEPSNQDIMLLLTKVATNHLHDLPGMREDLTKVLGKTEEIQKEQNHQSRQLVRLETTLNLPPMP